MGSILLEEVVAILLALEFDGITNFFADSLSAVRILKLSWSNSIHKKDCRRYKKIDFRLGEI